MKDKLIGTLGTFGIILFYLLSCSVIICPLTVIIPSGILSFVIAVVVAAVGGPIGALVTFVAWVVSLFFILGEPFSAFTVVYAIVFIFYLFTELIPNINAIRNSRR